MRRREFSSKVRVAAFKRADDDFWSRVLKTPKCWLWTGYRNANGYGICKRNVLAHRVAYKLAHAVDIPVGMIIGHSCDNPACVNPEHLWLGTQADNVRDMDRKGRGARTTRRGEASNKAKLTADQAVYIFNSTETGPALAARFGISKEAVNHIKTGRNWAHVTGGRRAP